MITHYITANPVNSNDRLPNGAYEGVYILKEETKTAIELRISVPAITVLKLNGKNERDILDNLRENAVRLLDVVEKEKQTTILLNSADNVDHYLEAHDLYTQWQDKVVEVISI